MGALPFHQVQQDQTKRHILGEVGVNADGAKQRLVARVAQRDAQASAQPNDADAERHKQERQKGGIERQNVHFIGVH